MLALSLAPILVIAKRLTLNFRILTFYFIRKKYEIATDEVGNPIKQDTKKGVLREVCSVYQHRYGVCSDAKMLFRVS